MNELGNEKNAITENLHKYPEIHAILLILIYFLKEKRDVIKNGRLLMNLLKDYIEYCQFPSIL